MFGSRSTKTSKQNMTIKKAFNMLLLIGIMAVAVFIAATLLSANAEGDYNVDLRIADGHSDQESAIPGENVSFYLTVENRGSENDSYTFDYRDVPDELTVSFPEGAGTDELEPSNQTTKRVRAFIEENTPPKRLFFNITATSDGNESVQKDIMLTVNVNETYGVEVTTDQPEIKDKDPGENATFIANVKNIGNTNETFQLSLLSGPAGSDARDWAIIEEGDQIVIQPGATKAVHVRIDIPAFSVENNDAQMGDYKVKLQAYPVNNDSKKKTVEFTVGVNAIFDLRIKSETPGKDEILEPEGETVLYYPVAVRNLANTKDTIDVTVPSDELSGEKSNWEPTFAVGGGSYEKILSISNMDSLAEKDVTMKLIIDDNTKEGQYTLRVKAKSQGDTAVYDHVTLYVNLSNPRFEAKIWADIPGKDSTLKANEDIEVTFILSIRNMGDKEDTFDIFVPSNEFPEDYDWKAYFGASGTQTEKTITLKSLSQATETLRIIIDKKTDEGNYELRVKAESQGNTSVYDYVTLYLNLTGANYGVKLQKLPRPVPKVNPADESEIEFKFTLTNTGNQDDTYTIEVETPLTSGTYKDWTMEFEDKDYQRVDKLVVPGDLTADTYLGKGDRIDITLYVMVDIDEDEGFYPDITISATSDNDNTQVDYLGFNLTVIKPNIRVTDDPRYFYIEGGLSDIEEGDSIDINLRVYNDGSAETDEFYVWFYNGKADSLVEVAGDFLTRERVDNIPTGQYTDVLVIWDNIPAGENDIYVFADKPIKAGPYKTVGPDGKFHPDGAVLETRENDNDVSIADEYQEAIDLRPDLTVTYIDYDDNRAGETTTVTVTIANVGSADAEANTATLWIKIGGEKLKDKTTNSQNPVIQDIIEVDDEIDIEFKWDIPNEVKNYSVSARVDHEDDSDSGNDKFYTWVVTVSGNGLKKDYDVEITASKRTIDLYGKNLTVLSLTVKNTGSIGDTYNLTVSGSYQGWNAALDFLQISLDPGEKETISLTLTKDPTIATEGEDFKVVITARSTTDEGIYDSVTVEGRFDSDDSDVIPFLPPAMTAAAIGGAGVVACFRRRRHL
ncbi:MAG: hypothetical protein KAU14_02855 [Thermoplasmata archaeon]|nr:hypothetical protein [Thermoplasmata archaeon]